VSDRYFFVNNVNKLDTHFVRTRSGSLSVGSSTYNWREGPTVPRDRKINYTGQTQNNRTSGSRRTEPVDLDEDCLPHSKNEGHWKKGPKRHSVHIQYSTYMYNTYSPPKIDGTGEFKKNNDNNLKFKQWLEQFKDHPTNRHFSEHTHTQNPLHPDDSPHMGLNQKTTDW
jgi:hypothetical protein